MGFVSGDKDAVGRGKNPARKFGNATRAYKFGEQYFLLVFFGRFNM